MVKLISLLLIFLYLRWTSAVSCDDLPCTPEKTEYSDQVAQCKHLNSTQRCLQTYTKTCKGNIPKDRQEYVNKLLTNTTTLRNFQCLNQVLCEDIKFCDTFDEKINKELEKNNFAQACRYFQDFVRCMNLSKDDCRREDSIDPTTSEQIQQILRANENWITANCSTAQRFQGTSNIGDPQSSRRSVAFKMSSSWSILVVSLYLAYPLLMTL